jgi:hypothetical protein
VLVRSGRVRLGRGDARIREKGSECRWLPHAFSTRSAPVLGSPDRSKHGWRRDARAFGEKVQFDCCFAAGCRPASVASGNTRHRRRVRVHLGRAAQLRARKPRSGTRASSCTASRPSSPPPAGNCGRVVDANGDSAFLLAGESTRRAATSAPTTARSSAPRNSARPSSASAPGNASSPPGDRTPTAASSASSSPSSTNIGAQRSLAHWSPRTRRSPKASSTARRATTTAPSPGRHPRTRAGRHRLRRPRNDHGDVLTCRHVSGLGRRTRASSWGASTDR